MIYFIIPASVLLLLAGWFFYSAYWCKGHIFSAKPRKKQSFGKYHTDEKARLAKERHEKLKEEFAALPFESMEITSHDGLKLKGRFYISEGSKDCVIIFHGYRSCPESDSPAIALHSLKRGFNVLAVYQRAHGESEGSVITFGVKERHDCKRWIEKVKERLGDDAKIMLSGISMGAATVMMASDMDIPCVKGIFADCGFSSPEGMFKAVINRLGYPVGISLFVMRTGARLFSDFDPKEASAVLSLKNSDIPLTIVHSTCDGYVPYQMAKECFDAAKTKKKKLLTVEEANHAYSYFYDTKAYLKELDDMLLTVKNG